MTDTNHGTATPPPLLKNGVPAHKLTKEDRRKGARASHAKRAEKRRQEAMTVRERLAELARVNVETIAAAFFDAMAPGVDARVRVTAATALLAEAYGRPSQALTGAGGGPIQVEHVDVAAARDKLLAQMDELAERREGRAIVEGKARTGTDG